MSSSVRTQPVPLFGGAMATELPTTMVDVSDFRQVPDNQEVYNDVDTGATVIVELLSRQSQVADSAAAEFFYHDLAQANGCNTVENGVTLTSSAALPPSAYPHLARPADAQEPLRQPCAYGGIALGMQRIAKYTNETGKENDVFVGLVVLRFLPPVATDILVTLSAPARLHPESSDAKQTQWLLTEEEHRAILHRAVAGLRVLEWGLFVPEEE